MRVSGQARGRPVETNAFGQPGALQGWIEPGTEGCRSARLRAVWNARRSLRHELAKRCFKRVSRARAARTEVVTGKRFAQMS